MATWRRLYRIQCTRQRLYCTDHIILNRCVGVEVKKMSRFEKNRCSIILCSRYTNVYEASFQVGGGP